MKKSVSVLLLALCASIISACGGGGTPDEKFDHVTLVNTTERIPDSKYISYKIPAGETSVQITSSNNGVIIEWIGGTGCATSSEVRTYNGTCAMAQEGQITIWNPGVLDSGAGFDEVVTILITKPN